MESVTRLPLREHSELLIGYVITQVMGRSVNLSVSVKFENRSLQMSYDSSMLCSTVQAKPWGKMEADPRESTEYTLHIAVLLVGVGKMPVSGSSLVTLKLSPFLNYVR